MAQTLTPEERKDLLSALQDYEVAVKTGPALRISNAAAAVDATFAKWADDKRAENDDFLSDDFEAISFAAAGALNNLRPPELTVNWILAVRLMVLSS